MKKNEIPLPIIHDLYLLSSKDFAPACVMLGKAFREDPIWNKILEDEPEKFRLIFGVPLKHALRYGKIYASSSDLEGLAAWLPSTYMKINFFQSIRSGVFMSALRLGNKIGKQIQEISHLLTKDRESHMKTPYVYLYVIGITPDHQGKGIGSNLINKMLTNLSPDFPIYLETETERNVRLYERLGFRVLKEITIPTLKLPMWEMLHDRK